MISFYRKMFFIISIPIALVFLTLGVMLPFIESDMPFAAIVPIGIFVASPVYIYDIYRGQWSVLKSSLIKSKEKYWAGCALLYFGVVGLFIFIPQYFSGEIIQFYDPEGSPKSRWAGRVLDYLNVNFGQWLPITIELILCLVMSIAGVKIMKNRYPNILNRGKI